MSFVEILIAIAVLTFGIIPIVHHIMSGARQTRISLRQVQAANHASNLMEALRSMGYLKLRAMPNAMVQLRGNENRWDKLSGGADIAEDRFAQDDGKGDESIFTEFQDLFFSGGGEPVVPNLESLFTRYYFLHRTDEDPYITIIVRVEWPAVPKHVQGGSGSGIAYRSVELRTLVADPYRGGAS